jgi:three-Cys-motif partner protein
LVRLLGSPLLALSVREPFSRIVLCERDPVKAEALRTRAGRIRTDGVHVLNVDANEEVAPVERLIPDGRTLGFCFVDPYDIDFNFQQMVRLTRNRRMDVLILLAVQMDARRNLEIYRKAGNQKISRLLGGGDWREAWSSAERDGVPFGRWLQNAFTEAMVRIGYVRPKDADVQSVTLRDANHQALYNLAFYSKHERGYDFWRKAVHYASDQIPLALDL